MKRYNVHLYREMRLYFQDIQAHSPEQAAQACGAFPCDEAASEALDCDGETFAALVDVQGDVDHFHSVLVELEAEKQRKAGRAALVVLDLVRLGLMTFTAGDAEFAGVMYCFDDQNPDWTAMLNAIGWDKARAAIAQAEAA